MKRILLVPDGAADEPLEVLNHRTPLQVANTPYLDELAGAGLVGTVQVTPPDMYPGSDAANMALLGYDPKHYYTGRGPIEAAAMGIPLGPEDVAFRCSLISTDGEQLVDYSAGHITTEEARPLIEWVNERLATSFRRLYPGVSYRHILVWKNGPAHAQTALPHENMGKPLQEIYPKGEGAEQLQRFIEESYALLDNHPFNQQRRAQGKPPANMLWPWSPGKAPELTPFSHLHGTTGAVIAAVDVIRGLGRLAGLEVVNVPGATGYFDTDYAAKGRYALAALQRHDFVWVHLEAPDEAGHQANVEEKIRAIENFDRLIVGTLVEGLRGNEPFRLLCAPDHKTPISTRGHAKGPVPFLFFDSQRPSQPPNLTMFDESALTQASIHIKEGWKLIHLLFDDA
jgi:2,3-bisphosphoglycerate-independent phosphoglycerate mutase